MDGCFTCGSRSGFLYTCKFCQYNYCQDHSDPVNHDCSVHQITGSTVQNATKKTSKTKSPISVQYQGSIENDDSEPDEKVDQDIIERKSVALDNWLNSKWLNNPPITSKFALVVSIITLTVIASITGVGILTETSSGQDGGAIIGSVGDSRNDGTTIEDLNRTNIERQVFTKVNTIRVDHELSPLKVEQDLREIARYHSQDMKSQGYTAHNSPDGETMDDRFSKFNYACNSAGEILFRTYFDRTIILENSSVRLTSNTEIANGIVDGWMNLEPQREMILEPVWQAGGVGVAITDEGVVYVTLNVCSG